VRADARPPWRVAAGSAGLQGQEELNASPDCRVRMAAP
jgi:hypothetical protein